MTSLELLCWPVVGCAVVVAAGVELKTGRLPMWVAVPPGLACLGARLVLEGPGTATSGLGGGALGALGCAAPFALLALAGGRVGWADVALLAAVGAGLGFPRALGAAFLVSICGAATAVVALWVRRRGPGVRGAGVHGSVDSERAIPYGVPIAVGAIWAMAWAGPAMDPDDGEALVPVLEQLDAGGASPGSE
ncbi:MAG: hypothetical protein INH41_16125 [Myxococcaceae bacterium]|nr:hypothetical protein [Myxococcaceae bacterium]MCA3013908.1 hypothetical protein [Myxococcaceae bacterium]